MSTITTTGDPREGRPHEQHSHEKAPPSRRVIVCAALLALRNAGLPRTATNAGSLDVGGLLTRVAGSQPHLEEAP